MEILWSLRSTYPLTVQEQSLIALNMLPRKHNHIFVKPSPQASASHYFHFSIHPPGWDMCGALVDGVCVCVSFAQAWTAHISMQFGSSLALEAIYQLSPYVYEKILWKGEG